MFKYVIIAVKLLSVHITMFSYADSYCTFVHAPIVHKCSSVERKFFTYNGLKEAWLKK